MKYIHGPLKPGCFCVCDTKFYKNFHKVEAYLEVFLKITVLKISENSENTCGGVHF